MCGLGLLPEGLPKPISKNAAKRAKRRRQEERKKQEANSGDDIDKIAAGTKGVQLSDDDSGAPLT